MNLEEEYRITTLSPLIDLKVVPPQMNEGIKLIGCCGKGQQSTLNIMKNEIQTNLANEVYEKAWKEDLDSLKKDVVQINGYINAHPELLKVANYVTDRIENKGVLNFLKKYFEED